MNSFNIDVTMGYELNAVAGGVYANSSIPFDYWDSNNILSGFDYVGAGTYAGYSYDNETEPGSGGVAIYTSAGGDRKFNCPGSHTIVPGFHQRFAGTASSRVLVFR